MGKLFLAASAPEIVFSYFWLPVDRKTISGTHIFRFVFAGTAVLVVRGTCLCPEFGRLAKRLYGETLGWLSSCKNAATSDGSVSQHYSTGQF
jgi:hypothetical protein